MTPEIRDAVLHAPSGRMLPLGAVVLTDIATPSRPAPFPLRARVTWSLSASVQLTAADLAWLRAEVIGGGQWVLSAVVDGEPFDAVAQLTSADPLGVRLLVAP